MKTTKKTKQKKQAEPQLVFVGLDAVSAYEQYTDLLKVGFTIDQAFELTKQAVKETFSV